MSVRQENRTIPQFRLNQRASGLLLHVTSLPGGHGIGDLGPAAYRFVDFLAAAGQRWWQVLPTGPTGPGHAPYSATSAFAGNPLLLSLERLAAEGLLDTRDLTPAAESSPGRVNYAAVAEYKWPRLRQACDAFVQGGGLREPAFVEFCDTQAHWLDDYALYAALRQVHQNRHWLCWKTGLRRRLAAALRAADRRWHNEVAAARFVQYQFDRQWQALKRYADQRGVGLIGDIPLFAAHDSSDVWSHRELFDLDRGGRPRTVSGVPPDYFSRTGQLWGHPHYRWSRHRATGFAWWLARFRRMFEQFDAVRLDHFLGFHRVWAVPGRAKTARRGRWVIVPGGELFAALRRELGPLPIIAEDLGAMTPAASRLRVRLGFPGMRILQFAFGGGAGSPCHRPYAYPRNCVVYPGTHDNETTVGWFERLRRARRARAGAEPTEWQRVLRYVGTSGHEIHWDFIRLALASPANLAIIPVQDVLGLDNAARMNAPGTCAGNWDWRLTPGALARRHAQRLRQLAETYDRLNWRVSRVDP
jgi:4-alpha-glucanotransferase